MNKFPNSFFSDQVYAQFKARSQVMGRDTGLDVFLQNKIYNGAWITAVSSVDDFERFGGMTEEPGLAKFYVLSGGAVMWNGTTLVKREGINFEPSSTVDIRNRNTAYYLTERSGLKPLPGITEFSIASVNRFGSVRKATIKFNVWSLDDLEVMDRLYFRPGYHLIAEWGHTWGLTTNGQIINSLAPILKNYPEYFKRGNDPAFITGLMKTTREKMDLNYDSFLGLITNFSWSFRTDLGYDCTLEVVSRGSVLESLTTKTGRPSTGEIENLGQQAPEDIHKTNFITRVMKIMSSIALTNQSNGEEHGVWLKHVDAKLKEKQFQNKEYSGDFKSLADMWYYDREPIQSITYPGSDVVVNFENRSYLGFNKYINVKDEAGERPETITYIPILVLFHIFNKFLSLSSSSKKIPRFNTKYAGEYLTFENHVTLDPMVTVLPKAPVKWPNAYPLKQTPLLVIDAPLNAFNIYVTEKVVSEKLYNMLNSEGQASEVNLYELTQGILGAINSALGGINELDLDFMEDTNEFVLIDRAMSSVYAYKHRDTVVNNKIIVAGLRSVATELSISTKISKSLGSMIAIASQGEDSKLNVHLGEFKEWNKNLIDRFDPPPANSAAANVADSVNTGLLIPNAPEPYTPPVPPLLTTDGTSPYVPNFTGTTQSPTNFEIIPSTGKTSYPKLPFIKPPPANEISYQDTVQRLIKLTDRCTAKAVFAVMVAEASKNKSRTGFRSAGGYNYAGVQTDSGRWGYSTPIIARYRRIDSGKQSREFAVFSNDDAFLDFMINRIKKKGFNGCNGDSWTSTYINSWWSPAARLVDPSAYKQGGQKFRDKRAIYSTAISLFDKYSK